jgi:NhaP-type Na+/H+ or K+/H+ antiporter
LPAEFGSDREVMKLMAFGVVLFTLLVQSTTMRPLLGHLGLVTRQPEQIEYEKRHARLTAARAALVYLERRHEEGMISSHAWEQFKPQLTTQIEKLAGDVQDVLKAEPKIEAEELDTAYRESLRAQRSAILGLRHDGVISDDVFNELSTEIDAALSTEYFLPDQGGDDKV